MSITPPTDKRPLSTDDYPTDNWLKELFDNYYDPCPLGGLENPNVVDALKSDWRMMSKKHNFKIFINPPYSNVKPFVEKAILTKSFFPDQKIVLLLKHDSSTHWYRMLHEAGAHFLPIQGRLKHGTGQACAFPSVLVVL